MTGAPADLASIILDVAVEAFRDRYGVDLRSDGPALERARAASERAAADLGRWDVVNVSAPFILFDGANPMHLDVTVSKREILSRAVRAARGKAGGGPG